MMNFAIAILAGGASQRMGSDKAQLRLGSHTFLEHTVAVATAVAPHIVVVGRDRPTGWRDETTRFLVDEQPGAGPLGGLVTALRYARRHEFAAMLLAACDMPGITAPAFQWLLNQADGSARHGCVAVNEGRLEPLFTVYTVELLEMAEEYLAQNRRALHRLIENGDFQYAIVPPELRPALLNVNTPEEFAQFESGLK